MNRKLLLLSSMLWVGTVQAQVLTFDDLAPTASYAPVNNGYGGFTWNDDAQIGYINGETHSPGSGYESGTVSGDYVAFNLWAVSSSTIAMIGSGTFDFVGAYFTSAWQAQTISFEGWYDGNLIYSSAGYAIDTQAPMWIALNWAGIDSLKILSAGGSMNHWAMDDFTFNPVPLPGAAWLFGTALIGYAGWASRRKQTS